MRHFGRFAITEAGLGTCLAFVAGAVNAGGFLLVGQYTSHMSGILSSVADAAALGAYGLMAAGLLACLSFLGGAALSAVLINWGRRHPGRPPYALPLQLEAALLLFLGLLGGLLRAGPVVALAVPLLCFLMGLQNATITKISGARIRTTHMTGVVTDLGIELGKLLYWNRPGRAQDLHAVRADRAKLRLLSALLAAFMLGGVLGAIAFHRLGFVSTLPLSALLLALARAMVHAQGQTAPSPSPGLLHRR